jgi:hypothetical protein
MSTVDHINYFPVPIINQAAYPDRGREEILEWAGLVPHWVMEFNIYQHDNLIDYLQERYQFGGLRNRAMEGKVDDKGTYRYPQDPDLEFLVRMDTKLGHCYIYPYGIVAIPDGKDKPHLIVRMD